MSTRERFERWVRCLASTDKSSVVANHYLTAGNHDRGVRGMDVNV